MTTTPTTITAEDMHRKVTSGDVKYILDVRTPVEYAQGYVSGSVLIPIDELGKTIGADERFSKNEPIYIMCQSGGRATRAADMLRDKGYAQCCVIEGGMNAWTASKLPHAVAEGAPKLSLVRQVHLIIGFFTALGAVLGLWVNPYFTLIPLVTGCGLFFAGATGFCGLALVLPKMPWNRVDVSCCRTNSCSKD